MVSAADLQRQHASAHGTTSSTTKNDIPILENDPFPDLSSAAAPGATNVNVAPATSAAAVALAGASSSAAAAATGTAPAKMQRGQQPDFSSESAFPSLGAGSTPRRQQWGKGAPGATSTSSPAASSWTAPRQPVISRTVAQDSFSIALAPSDLEGGPGGTASRISAALQKLHTKYRNKVKVEASTSRARQGTAATTTFVLRGDSEKDVKAAKKELTVLLARNVTLTLDMPASLRAYIIGPKGATLKGITDGTSVKVDIPKSSPAADGAAGPDADVDETISIAIAGDEINARAVHAKISSLVGERTRKQTVRVTEEEVDRVWWPFLSGPKAKEIEARARELAAQSGEDLPTDPELSIRVPPRAALLPPRESNANGNGVDAAEGASKERERDLSIVLVGDRSLVSAALSEIHNRVAEMSRSYRTLEIGIPKRQHRFLTGENANSILASTGCIIELTSIDDPSESVTIRGPAVNLAAALTSAMEKANAVKVETVDVLALHRNVSSPLEHAKIVLRWSASKMPRVQGVQIFLPRPAIVASSGNVQIEIVGEDAEEVRKARTEVEALCKKIIPSFVRVIDVDPLAHRFVIGKKGSNLQQFEAKGVEVRFPPVESEARSDVLLVISGASAIEGFPSSAKERDAAAKSLLDEVATEVERQATSAADIRTETILVPGKLHRTIVGPNGTTLNAVLGEDRLVQVTMGSTGNKAATGAEADEIVVRGPSSEVTRVLKELQRIAADAEQDAIVNGHTVSFSVDAAHVAHLVGRGGAAIQKLREELGVRVDISDSRQDSDAPAAANGKTTKKAAAPGGKATVTLVGRKENVEEAQRRLQSQVEKLQDETSITIKVPAKMHGAIIGSGGKYVTRLQDTYGVRIDFPRSEEEGKGGKGDQKADEVIVRGGKKGVEGAKAELLELLDYEKEHNNIVTLTVSTKAIPRIMGKGGATINQIREDTDAQIDFDRVPGESSATSGKGNEGPTTSVKLRGTKKAIAEAQKAIQAIAAEVDSEATYVVRIPSEHHGQLIGPSGQNVRELILRAGGPEDVRASSQMVIFPRRGDKNADADAITVRGPKAIADKIRKELDELAASLASRVVRGVVVAQPAQRMLVGRGGSRLQELSAKHGSGTRIVMPGWKEYASLGEPVNAAELKENGGDENTIVKLQGDSAAVEALQQEIESEFASVTKSIEVPAAAHAKISAGGLLRQIRSETGVVIDAPRAPKVGGNAPQATSSSTARIDADDETDYGFTLEKIAVAASAPDSESKGVTYVLSGKDAASLSKATSRLERAISDASSGDGSSGSATHRGTLTLPSSSIPRIVGRGGAGLQALQDETGTRIDIPRNKGGLCFVEGDEEGVRRAKERLVEIVESGRRADDY